MWKKSSFFSTLSVKEPEADRTAELTLAKHAQSSSPPPLPLAPPSYPVLRFLRDRHGAEMKSNLMRAILFKGGMVMRARGREGEEVWWEGTKEGCRRETRRGQHNDNQAEKKVKRR